MANPPLIRRPLSAGSEIDAWCTRCKMDLGHRIVAMVGTAPKRVLCMTCGSEHNYRSEKKVSSPGGPPKTKTTKSPAKASASGRSSTARSREEWEKRVRSGKPMKRYSIVETYAMDDLVTHKKFGDGYVSHVSDGKVTVVFIDGERTLIQGASS